MFNVNRKYAIRKLSVATASVCIGLSFMSGVTVSAQDVSDVAISHRYVTYDELTPDEQKLIQTNYDELKATTNADFYMVYKPDGILPKTGDLAGTSLLMGGCLLLAAVVLGKNKKHKITAFVLLSASGVSLMSSDALAITSGSLSSHDMVVTVKQGDKLPTPKIIDGFRFVGYIDMTKDVKPSSQAKPTVSTNLEGELPPVVEKPTLDIGVSNINGELPPVEQEKPVLDIGVSNLEGELPPVEQEKPVLDSGVSNINGELPPVEPEKPALDIAVSNLEGELPPVVQEKPTLDIAVSNLEGELPPVEQEKPVLDIGVSNINGELPPVVEKSALDISNINGELPPVEQEKPVLDIAVSNLEGELPPVEVEKPALDIAVSNLEGELPPVEQEKPALDIAVSNLEGELPPVEQEKPALDIAVSNLEGELPPVESKPEAQVTTETTPVPKSTRYVPDVNVTADERTITYAGQDGSVSSTTITINGKGVTTEQRTPARDSVVTVGTKPKLTVRTTPFDTVYRADEALPFGERDTQSEGQDGITEVTQTYELDTVTGVLAPQPETTHIKQVKLDKIVKVGTRPVETITPIKFETRYEDSDQLLKGVENTKQKGVDGRKVVTTTYTVDPITGDVTPKETERIEPATDAIIERGTKTEVVKPTVSFARLTEDALKRDINLTHTFTDPDKRLKKVMFNIYDGKTLVKSVEVAPGSPIDVTEGLDYDTPYEVETSFVYDSGSGDITETLPDKEPFELELKKIQFKEIEGVSLFEMVDNKPVERSALAGKPADVSNFYMKVDVDGARDAYVPISKIDEVDINGVKAFKITADLDELVQNRGEYNEDFEFTIRKADISANGIYHTFSDLIDAIRKNPAGEFTIGSDLYASKSTNAYIHEFTGKLLGGDFAIYDLSAPLFEKLEGTVQDIDLKRVAIDTAKSYIGSLASQAHNATVTNVVAQGVIKASSMVGGIIGKAVGGNYAKLQFEGSVESTFTPKDKEESYTGGIIGRLEEANLTQARVNATVKGRSIHANQRIAGVVGSLRTDKQNTLSKIHVKGDVVNTGTYDQGAAGIVGAVYSNGGLMEAVTEANVTGGVHLVGDLNARRLNRNNVKVSPNAIATKIDQHSRARTAANALDLIPTFGLDMSVREEGLRIDNRYRADLTSVKGYDGSKVSVYDNITKLMPFYNVEQIVKYGNKLQGELADKVIKSVTPMKGNDVVTKVTAPGDIDKVLIHFADGTVTTKPVTFKETFRNSGVLEYNLENVIYTPEMLVGDYSDIANRISDAIRGIEYNSKATANKVGLVATLQQISEKAAGDKTDEATAERAWYSQKMDELYLKPTIETIKANLGDIVHKLLATDASINTNSGVIADAMVHKLTENKEKLLFGLAYMQRWYNINFADMNVRDLMTFHQDFGGEDISTIDWLIEVGSNYTNLHMSNNAKMYADNMNVSGPGILDYYRDFREKFTTFKDENEWFKATSKLYVNENPSLVDPTHDVSIWSRLSPSDYAIKHILPLLSTERGIYAITSMNGIMFGTIDAYKGEYFKDRANITDEEWAKFEKRIRDVGIWHRDYFDFWYRIANEDAKPHIKQNIHTWDKSGWSPWFGDDISPTMRDFFGPIGTRWSKGGSAAYANGFASFFASQSALNAYGQAVYSHETTHNMDGRAFLGRFGRKSPSGAEHYARGLLESIYLPTQNTIGINMSFDFTDAKNNAVTSRTLMHNTSPSRFQSERDINEYIKGMFDVIYSLDIIEAQYALDRGKVGQMFLQMTTNHEEKQWLPTMVRHLIPQGVQINTLEDFVEHELISAKYKAGDKDGFGLTENGYWPLSFTAPIFGTGTGPKGVAHDLMYRRMAWEAWANNGYSDGFLNYASNKIKITDNLPKGVDVHDDMIANKLSAGGHSTLKSLKKEWIREHADKLVDLKPITFTMGTTTHNITSYEQLRDLIYAALDYDTNNFKDTVSNLKQHIYSAYLKLTDEFRSSIYKK